MPTDDCAKAADEISEVERLRRDVAFLKTCSTVEMMCENPSVDAHIREWEARCLAAEARIAELKREVQTALESTIPTGGDYVCSQCCIQRHDECDKEGCDCIHCLKAERDALAKRCARAEAQLARLVEVIRECARDDLGTTAKSIMASNVLREIEEDRDAS